MNTIYSFIYTKVLPEKSPLKKSGFHTLFYPIHFLDKKDLLEMETKIHFAGSSVLEKQTIFFQSIKGQIHVFILFLTALPEEKDEHGRSGVFMVHGFIFPPSLWQNTSIQTLTQAILPSVFRSQNDFWNSPLIDVTSGNLLPIELAEQYVNTFEPLTKTEKQLFCVIYKVLLADSNDIALIIKANPDIVFEYYQRMFNFLPHALKKNNVGFDTALDNGRIFFYPLKLVGYNQTLPTTGSPFIFNAGNNTFEPHEKLSDYIQPGSFYERWIVTNIATVSADNCENMYSIAQFLEGKIEKPTTNIADSFLETFAQANEQALRSVFVSYTQMRIGSSFALAISISATAPQLLNLLIGNENDVLLANVLGEAIVQNKLSTENTKEPLPKNILGQSGNFGKALISIWEGQATDLQMFEQFSEKEKSLLLSYVAQTNGKKTEWYVQLLFQNPKIANSLCETGYFANAESWLAPFLATTFQPVGAIIAMQLIKYRLFHLFSEQESAYFIVLSTLFSEPDSHPTHKKQALAFLKTQQHNPHIGNLNLCYVAPTTAILSQIKHTLAPETKLHLLIHHIVELKFLDEKLQELGWTSTEIELAKKQAPVEGFEKWLKKLKFW